MSLTIAIQGGAASFHDVVALNYFGKDTQRSYCDSFRAVCEQLADGSADFAVMAIENSIAGTIMPNYSLLQEYGFSIVGEVQLRIEMNMMVLPGVKIEDVTVVRSHYMALLQCEAYLAQYPWISKQEYHDTADSAKDIKRDHNTNMAAIASRYAAELYDLEVVEYGIETNKKNFTRFYILSRDTPSIDPSLVNKATLHFQLIDQVGALANVLKIIVDNNINLVKIQSIPILGKPGEYTFFVECEFVSYSDFEHIFDVSELVQEFKILGVYTKAVPLYS